MELACEGKGRELSRMRFPIAVSGVKRWEAAGDSVAREARGTAAMNRRVISVAIDPDAGYSNRS
jgi:hypothetical protein